MDLSEKKTYAEWLIKRYATDVEFLSIVEMSEEVTGREIDQLDADDVATLIAHAKVEVSW